MTDKPIPSVEDDIAYMKALAADGRRAPLMGGSILVAAGTIFGVASVAHWAILTDLIAAPSVAFAWLWFGSMGVFAVTLAVLINRVGKDARTRTSANRAASTAWMGVGLTIFVMSLSMSAVAWRLEEPAVFAVFPSLILALYGAGWAVSGEMSGTRWFWWLAIGAWVGAPILGLLTGRQEQFLAYAVAIVLLTVVPGLAMMKAAKGRS